MLRSNFEHNPSDTFNLDFKKSPEHPTFRQQYGSIKQLEGEMFQFYTSLQQQPLELTDSRRLEQLINSIRYLLHAAKGAKDIHKNLMEMRNSTNSGLNTLFEEVREGHVNFYIVLEKLLHEGSTATLFEELTEMLQKSQTIYQQLLETIYRDLTRKELTQIEISTILNVNRELYSSRKALIMAIKDNLLSFQESLDFQNLPVSVSN
jgi:phosphate:Na+ symporter